MMTTKTKVVVGVALLAAGLLLTGIAWAKSAEYSVNCTFTYGGTYTAKYWADEDGTEHIRGIVFLLNSDPNSGNIEIHSAGVCNHNREMVVAGTGDFWGYEYAQVTWGGLTGTFQGSHGGTRTNFYDSSAVHIYDGVDGDFVGWKLRLNATYDMHPDVKAGSFAGTLLNPHGD